MLLALLRFVLSLFGMVLLVRYLESSEYGALVLFMGLPGLINLIFSFGHDHFIRRFVPSTEDTREVNKIFFTILIRKLSVTIIVSSVLLLCFRSYSEKFGISEYFSSFMVYQLAIVSNVGSKYFKTVFNALFLQKYELISDALFQVFKITAINVGILLGWDFHLFVISFTLIRLLRTATEVILFSRRCGLMRVDKSMFRFAEEPEQKKYRRTSYFLSFGTTFLNTNIDHFILSFSSNNVQVAIYAIANSLLKKIESFIPAKMLSPLIEPAFYSRYDHTKSQNDLDRMFQFICITGSLISFLMIALLVPLGKDILSFLFNREYVAEAYWPMIMFTVYILVSSIPLGLPAKAIMKPEIILAAQISGALNIILGFLLAARYGAIGMAVATNVSILLRQTILFLSLRKHITISMPWNQLLRLMINAAIVATLIFELKKLTEIHFLILSLIGLIAYLLLTFKMFSVFSNEHKRFIFSLLPPKMVPVASHLF